MWQVKRFNGTDAERKAREWIRANSHRFQCQLIFIHNGCGVEYRKLRIIA